MREGEITSDPKRKNVAELDERLKRKNTLWNQSGKEKNEGKYKEETWRT